MVDAFDNDDFNNRTSLQDDEAFDDHYRKTFTNQHHATQNQGAYTSHEMMIPQGLTAKLIRIADPGHPDFNINDIAERLEFISPTPAIVLSGA